MRLTDEQIGAELHALRETPSERFAAELDQRVEGLVSGEAPATAPLGERLTQRFALRRLLPIAAAAATAIVVVGIALSQSLGGDEDLGGNRPSTPAPPSSAVPEGVSQSGGTGAAKAVPQTEAAGDTAAGVSGTAIEPAPGPVPPLPPDEQLKPGQERIQEQSASMTLSTDPGQVDEVADGVVEVTERYDGIVVSSDVSTSDGKGRASFDLRIPTQNLQATLADLSDLADVSSRDEGTLDITTPFVSADERFDDAKAEVDALLEQLADADSASEIASIRQQLQFARSELAAARAELGALKQRADFSRLSIAVVGNGDGDGWSIGDAADDAVDVLEALGGATLVTLAVLIPLSGLAFLIWLAATRLRRRRRERALDES